MLCMLTWLHQFTNHCLLLALFNLSQPIRIVNFICFASTLSMNYQPIVTRLSYVFVILYLGRMVSRGTGAVSHS